MAVHVNEWQDVLEEFLNMSESMESSGSMSPSLGSGGTVHPSTAPTPFAPKEAVANGTGDESHGQQEHEHAPLPRRLQKVVPAHYSSSLKPFKAYLDQGCQLQSSFCTLVFFIITCLVHDHFALA